MNVSANEGPRTPTNFRRWRCNGWTVLSVSGPMDAAGVQELERQFAAAVASGVSVAVDLSHATVVDSPCDTLDESLEDVLTGMDRLLRAFGGRLAVLGGGVRVASITRGRSESGAWEPS